MNDAAKWWYYVRQNGGYYPQTVANLGYDVWDWSTLNAGTLFQDSAKTTPASANGDVVGCWTDGVGGVDATQVTTANKPGLATASLNGLPTLSFDGSDLLATGNISISTFVIWVVFDSNVAGRMIYEQSVNASTNDGMYLYSQASISNPVVFVRRGTSNSSKQSTSALSASFSVLRHENNGTHDTNLMYIDNALQTTTTIGGANDVGTGTATQPLFIGARSGPTIGFTGNIAQLLIVSPYPTAEIIANMESYINNLWSVY